MEKIKGETVVNICLRIKDIIFYFAIINFIVVISSSCKPKIVHSDSYSINNSLEKSIVLLSDDLKKICSTNVDKLDNSNINISTEIKKIVESSGALYRNQKRAICVDALANELQKTMQLQKQNYNKQELIYDIVMIGGGVHAAIFNATFLKKNPQAKVLVIDKSPIIASHFKSNAYRINSPVNFPVGQTNTFANAPIQLEDFIWFKKDDPFNGYPYAKALWNEIVLANFASGADFLLGTEIIQIKENNTKNSKYSISTNNFGEIKAKKIVISTGLGEPNFSQGPPAFIKEQRELAKQCEYEDCLPQVMTFDDLLAIDAAWSLQNRKGMQFASVVDVLDNKQVALIGGGDSSFVVLEYLYLTTVERLEKVAKKTYDENGMPVYEIAQRLSPSPEFLTWVGAFFSDKDEFYKLVTEKKIKARYNNVVMGTVMDYHDIFQRYFNKNDRLERVDPQGEHITISLVNKTNNHESIQENIDYVIVATGYDNSRALKNVINSMLNKQDATKDWQELFPFIDVDGKRTARRLELNGVFKDIYLIGTAAGVGGPIANSQLATPKDIEASITKNPASINVLGPYSERFAQWLSP
jgi:hypothetical protein